MRKALRLALALAPAPALAACAAAQDQPKPTRVEMRTADGLRIVGDLYERAESAPTVLCLPMYRHTRATWRPIVPQLLAAGLNAFALDLRGHGESAPELAERVRARDPQVFNAMTKDVAAAVAELAKRGFDTSRLALLGASVGCSVAVATLAENPGPFRACVLMTPGAHYLGVDTLADAKRFPGVPLLILTSEEEAPRVKVVARALAGPRTELVVVPGANRHGTRMFGKVAGIERRIARFLAAALTPDALLVVPRFAAEDPVTRTPGFIRRTLRVTRGAPGAGRTLLAYGLGSETILGAMVEGPFRGRVVLTLGARRITAPLDSAKAPPASPVLEVEDLGDLPAPKAEGGSFRGRSWILVHFPPAWFAGKAARLALRFEPAGGRPLALPAAGAFRPVFRDQRPAPAEAAGRRPHPGARSKPSRRR